MKSRLYIILLVAFAMFACSPFAGLQSDEAEVIPTAAPTAAPQDEPTATSAPVDPTATAASVDNSAAAPFISGDLCEGLSGSRAGVSGVRAGQDLNRITLQGEGVVCNDGTPAVMFVKRASNPDNESVWVFHFQGGGACNEYGVSARKLNG